MRALVRRMDRIAWPGEDARAETNLDATTSERHGSERRWTADEVRTRSRLRTSEAERQEAIRLDDAHEQEGRLGGRLRVDRPCSA